MCVVLASPSWQQDNKIKYLRFLILFWYNDFKEMRPLRIGCLLITTHGYLQGDSRGIKCVVIVQCIDCMIMPMVGWWCWMTDHHIHWLLLLLRGFDELVYNLNLKQLTCMCNVWHMDCPCISYMYIQKLYLCHTFLIFLLLFCKIGCGGREV